MFQKNKKEGSDSALNDFSTLSRKKSSSSFDNEMEQNLSLLENGKLYIIGEITTEKCEQIVKLIHKLEGSDFVDLKEKELTIYLNTEGGNTEDAICIHDLIRKFAEDNDVNIVTVGAGSVLSAGALILQCGDERCMTKNSLFMLHENWYSISDEKTSAHEDTLRAAKILDKVYFALVTKKCNAKSRKELRKLFDRRDTYLTSNECLGYGLIDKIV